VRASLLRRLESVDEVVPVLLVVLERPHPALRAAVLRVASLESQDEGNVLRLSGLGGSRIRGVEGEGSRGEKSQESIGRLVRGNPIQS
jgi:hypothetical protein